MSEMLDGRPVEETEMWGRACTLSRVVASTVRVAESAGATIKAILDGGDLRVVDKAADSSSFDPQTEADRAAQYLIVHSLLHKFSKMTIIGEEEKTSKVDLEHGVKSEVLSLPFPEELQEMKEEDLVVWVDPLDGTGEIAKAKEKTLDVLQQVTVLIGIAHKGRVVGGVVHQPWHAATGQPRTVWAVQGLGLHGTAPAAGESGEKVIMTTRSHSTQSVEDTLQELQRRGLCDRVERVGGAGFKVLKVLDGAAAYVFASAGCKKWDTAAPQAILEAAGGRLTDISGRPLVYSKDVQHSNSGGVLATAPWTRHEDYVQAIPDSLKQQLPEFTSRK